MRVTVAQMNPTVGNIDGNLLKNNKNIEKKSYRMLRPGSLSRTISCRVSGKRPA